MKDVYSLNSCRICHSQELKTFLDLGDMPLPNAFLREEALNMSEMKYPLKVCRCMSCGLVQLTHVVSAQEMFGQYYYIPSTSQELTDHFESIAYEICDEVVHYSNELVIDVGSNDGTLLSFFRQRGCKILGIDPAQNIACEAQARGIPTMNAFFSHKVARSLRKKMGLARIITATNVIAHIDDIHDIFEGIRHLLHKDGLFVLEVPYLGDLLQRNEFDTIYHEHLSYFSLRPLLDLVNDHALKIVNVKREPIHGGSIRVYITHTANSYLVNNSVSNMLEEEEVTRLYEDITYVQFAQKVQQTRKKLIALIRTLQKEGKTIIGYGAAAKGNILMNYCGITTRMLQCIVDSIPYKHNMYTPGTHIPIYSEDAVQKYNPDVILILAWNFAREIISKNKHFIKGGGQFIIPLPNPHILASNEKPNAT